MAITYVGGKTVATAQSGNWSTSLTNLLGGSGSAPIEGDTVVAVYSVGSSSDLDIGVVTAGYVELAELYANSNYDINLSVSWKRMGVTPDTNIIFSTTGGTAYGITVAVQVWRGVDEGTTFDATSTTATGTGSGALNAPAITATTDGSVILVAGGMGGRQGAQTFTAPELLNFLTVGYNASQDSSVGLGSFAWTSGSYDPSAWGFSVTPDGTGGWAAVTMALRPAMTAAALTATSISTAVPTIGTASVAQSHNLTASSIATAAPTIQAAIIGQAHSLTAQGIATAAPTIASASLAQSHALTTVGIATGQPTIGAASISQLLELTASGIATGTPTLGSASLAQVHGLSSQGVATAQPSAGTGSISQTHMLGSQGVATSSLKVSSASAGQIHILAVTGIATGTPSIGASVAKLIHAIVAGELTTAPATVSFAQLNQLHALSAVGQATGSPTLPDTWLAQLHALVSREIKTGSVRIGKPDTRLPSVRRIATEAMSANYATKGSGPNRVTSSSGPNTLTEH